MPLSHIDQFGSTRMFSPAICNRNEAWPIQVMPISAPVSAGKSGAALGVPLRRSSSEGRKTSTKKLRLCQPFSSFTPTRLAGLAGENVWPSAGDHRAVEAATGGTTGASGVALAAGGFDFLSAFAELAGHGRKG